MYLYLSRYLFIYKKLIQGQVVTWIVPHVFGAAGDDLSQVDVKIMSVFTEFYTTMLGFINFRLVLIRDKGVFLFVEPSQNLVIMFK